MSDLQAMLFRPSSQVAQADRVVDDLDGFRAVASLVLQVLPIRDDDQQGSVICHVPGDGTKYVGDSTGWDVLQHVEQTDDVEGPVKANVGDITAVIADVVPPLRHC